MTLKAALTIGKKRISKAEKIFFTILIRFVILISLCKN